MKLAGIIVAYLCVINLVTYLAFRRDKQSARRDTWRVPESRLHWLCLLGGSPAGWLAMRRLRHKTSKLSFRAVFWAIVTVQAVAIVVAATPWGREILHLIVVAIDPASAPE